MGSEETDRKTSSYVLACCKMSFSYIGLGVIVVLYTVMGAFLFQLLEEANEVDICVEGRKEYMDMENETLSSLVEIVYNNSVESEALEIQVTGLLESFRNNSLSISYDGRWCEGYGQPDGPDYIWSWAGAFMFSVTVITTIGYGHIAPKTIWGRLLCISYAMIGIPLMLMFLANLGETLANVFRFIYSRVICCGCFKVKDKTIKKKQTPVTMEEPPSTASRTGSYLDLGGASTPDQAKGRWMTEPTSSPLPDGTQVKQRIITHQDSGTNIQPMDKMGLINRKKNLQQQPLVIDDLSDDGNDEDEDDYWLELQKTQVPLTVAMAIIGLYLLGGAILFQYWEGWDLLQSSYFCFISLSSIGFGDVTPGNDYSSAQANAQLVIGSIYTVFGMAILSMCFALMQEEIVEKVNWVGEKVGIVDKDKLTAA